MGSAALGELPEGPQRLERLQASGRRGRGGGIPSITDFPLEGPRQRAPFSLRGRGDTRSGHIALERRQDPTRRRAPQPPKIITCSLIIKYYCFYTPLISLVKAVLPVALEAGKPAPALPLLVLLDFFLLFFNRQGRTCFPSPGI